MATMKNHFSTSMLVVAALMTYGALNVSSFGQATKPTTAVLEPKKADQTALDNDGLKKILDGMGLQPKALSKGFLIAIKRDTWTYNMQLVLSSNGTKLGFNANLGKIDDPDAVTASQWKELLISNGDIDPSAFYFDKDQKKLYLHRSLDNRSVTAAFLRPQIDSFCDNIKKTENLWKFTK